MATFEKVCIALTIAGIAGLISMTLMWVNLPY
jgi:hypothetical protein